MGVIKDFYDQTVKSADELRKNGAPDPTDRQKYIEYRAADRRAQRRLTFIRSAVRNAGLDLNQVKTITEGAIGAEEFKKFRKNTLDSNRYYGTISKMFKANYPERYKELYKQGVNVTGADGAAIMQKEMRPEEVDQALAAAMMMQWSRLDEAKLMEEAEKAMTPQQRSAVEEKINSYRDIADLEPREQTKPRYGERIQELRDNIPEEIRRDPQKLEKVQKALDYANSHLTIVDAGYKEERDAYEKDIQKTEVTTKDKIVDENIATYQGGKYQDLTKKESIGRGTAYLGLNPGKEQGAKELFADGSMTVSEKTANAFRRIFQKFDEMEMLRPGEENPTNGEDGFKVYAHRRLKERKQEMSDALLSGDYDRIVEAQANLEKAWNDMEELYQIARENFSQDRTIFPGNVDGTRNSENSWEFVGDIMTTAQVNACFIAYNECKVSGKSIEDYLKNPVEAALHNPNRVLKENSLNGLTQGKSFDECMDIFAQGNQRSVGLSSKVAPCMMGTERAMEPMTLLDPDPEYGIGNRITEKQAYGMFMARLEHESNALKFFTAGDLSPEGKQLQNQAIQNLITVSDEDRAPMDEMLGIPGIGADGTAKKPFDVKDYVRNHPVDYAGMIARTQSMVNKFSNVPGAPGAYEISGAAYEAYQRVLDAKKAEKGTPGYDMLEREARRLYTELTADRNCPETIKNQMDQARARNHGVMREYLEQLRGAQVQGEGAKLYGEFLDSVESLTDLADELTAMQAEGKAYPLKGEDLDNLIRTYQNTLASAENYRVGAPKGAQLDEARRDIIGKVQGLLAVDLAALHAAKNAGLETTFPEIMENARTRLVDIGDQKLETAGANMSSRIHMTIPGPDGKMIEGFFTEETTVQDQAKEYADLAAKMKGKHPEIAEFIDRLEGNEEYKLNLEGGFFSSFMTARDDLRGEVNEKDRREKFARVQRKLGYSDDEISRTTPEQAQAMADYLQERALITNKHTLFRNYAGIRPGDNVDKRNSAMTAMADLLQMGDVIAPSTSLKVKVGDKVMNGTFMAFAKGQDVLKAGTDLTKADLEQLEKKAPIGQIADLNVLDYLCGNLDRHAGNIFYNFDKETGELKGVQGIDNDLSFGRKKASGLQAVKLKDIPVMSQKTADIVMSLDANVVKTMLRQYDLPEESLNQVGERLTTLQNEIVKSKEYFKENRVYGKTVEGKIRICSDEEMKKLTLEDVTKGHDRFGLDRGQELSGAFSKVRGLQTTAISTEINQVDKELLTLKDEAFQQSKELSECSRALEEGKRNTWFGTKEYDNMAAAVSNLARKREETFTGDLTQEKLDALKEAYEQNEARIRTYLDRKAKEKDPSDASKRRQAAARKTMEHIGKAKKSLADMSEKLSRKERLGQEMQLASDRSAVEKLKAKLIAQDEAYKFRMEEREAEVDRLQGKARMFGEASLKAMKNLHDYAMGEGPVSEGKAKQIKNLMAVTVLCQMAMNEREKNPNGPYPIEEAINTPEKLKAAAEQFAQSPEFEKGLADPRMDGISRAGVNEYVMHPKKCSWFTNQVSDSFKIPKVQEVRKEEPKKEEIKKEEIKKEEDKKVVTKGTGLKA